ncbi:PRC-barrel domain-containing protein [Radicibacter daui]|uniref:PRC-barrel domain-containing protein n=1 Tax=Radicibacter daui TaxID=3064829 RepID=UPI004046D3EA
MHKVLLSTACILTLASVDVALAQEATPPTTAPSPTAPADPSAPAAPLNNQPAAPSAPSTAAPANALPSGDKILDMPVVDNGGEKVGNVVDVVYDNVGAVDEVIVSTGGFLGIGSHDVALDASSVSVAPDGGGLQVAMSEDEVKQLPEWKGGKEPS